jgi:hypothetical protein
MTSAKSIHLEYTHTGTSSRLTMLKSLRTRSWKQRGDETAIYIAVVVGSHYPPLGTLLSLKIVGTHSVGISIL